MCTDSNYTLLHDAHIAVTDDPEQVMPSHDWPQGSPPFACQPLRFPGEFKLVKSVLRAVTARTRATNYYNRRQAVSLVHLQSQIAGYI